MRSGADFTAAVRRGRRSAGSTLVLHLTSADDVVAPTRVGLVVSKAVGNSVVRHRVARRLRALCADRMSSWHPGELVVVRALPASGAASSDRLGRDLDAAAARLGLSVAA